MKERENERRKKSFYALVANREVADSIYMTLFSQFLNRGDNVKSLRAVLVETRNMGICNVVYTTLTLRLSFPETEDCRFEATLDAGY